MKIKVLTLIFLSLSIIVSMTACGTKTNDDEQSKKNNITTSSNAPDTTSSIKSEDNNIVLSDSYKVPGKNIVIDVPNYQEMEKGYTQLYILHGVKYVAVTADDSVTASSVMDAHEKAFDKFKENIQNYSYVNALSITSEVEETINGINVYRYEGTLNCALDYSNREKSYDAYVVGYSFIMDGVPCTITGSVIEQSQSDEMISEIRDTVDAMIKTLRSSK